MSAAQATLVRREGKEKWVVKIGMARRVRDPSALMAPGTITYEKLDPAAASDQSPCTSHFPATKPLYALSRRDPAIPCKSDRMRNPGSTLVGWPTPKDLDRLHQLAPPCLVWVTAATKALRRANACVAPQLANRPGPPRSGARPRESPGGRCERDRNEAAHSCALGG